MTIHLSADREQFIRALVEAGQFPSEDAVIEAALQLLQEQDDEEGKLSWLRHDVAAAIAQADRDELTPFDPHATLTRIRERQATGANQP